MTTVESVSPRARFHNDAGHFDASEQGHRKLSLSRPEYTQPIKTESTPFRQRTRLIEQRPDPLAHALHLSHSALETFVT